MADDTLLLSTTVNGLQVMIDNAYNYGRKWRLEYSVSKTKCITFGESSRRHFQNKTNREWHLGGMSLEEVNTYTYLGIILSSDGTSRHRTEFMSKKGYSSFGVLKGAGFHSNGLSPLTCGIVWQRMLRPSMLYGCEIWGKLSKKETYVLECVQKKIGKSIQGLHRRTHDEIVRGLLGWHTVEGTIDIAKLNFVYKLITLPGNNVIKHIFLCQMFGIVTGSMTATCTCCITADLWATVSKYGLQEFVTDYLMGAVPINKFEWKQYAKAAVHDLEESLYCEGLQHKNSNRFLRIHPSLVPHPFYEFIKHNLESRTSLLNTIKLLAYPEHCTVDTCDLCLKEYTDTVEHYVLRCQSLVETRCQVFDAMLDALDCWAEAELLSQDDTILLETLLSKNWTLFTDDSEYINFSKVSANVLTNLLYVL